MDNTPALLDGLETLEKRLLTQDRVFTVGDAAAITGYRTDQAKQLLDRLIVKYDCKLKVTENGDLIYDFGTRPHKRGARTWAEWYRGVQKWCWKAFMLLFRIWISLTLVVYFAIFVLILIAIIIAATASNKSSDSSSSDDSDGGMLGGFFRIFADIFISAFRWNTHIGSTHYETDANGYPYRSYDASPSPIGRKSKSFVASVYDYVFGPQRVEANPLANQLEAATHIRLRKGIIVVPEIIALAGWKAGEAENFLSDLVVRYQGEAKISEESVLYGDFTEFARQKTAEGTGIIKWYWEEYEPEYKLTGNSFWRNVWITFLCGFNLIFALVFVAIQLNPNQSSFNFTPEDAWVFVVLGWIPFVFSVIFFTLPIMRWMTLPALRKKRKIANIRKRVMRTIYLSKESYGLWYAMYDYRIKMENGVDPFKDRYGTFAGQLICAQDKVKPPFWALS